MPTARRASAAAGAATPTGPRTLKKYPNRRLYDTRTSSYITLADVKKMVLAGDEFDVRDAKSGDDITRTILLQIILEEESGGVPMFSTPVLAQIIRFYGNAMQGVMGPWLERNMQVFSDMQTRMAEQTKGLYPGSFDPGKFTPEAWTQFLSGQAPAMAGLPELMNDYLKQLNEQLQKAGSLFPGFPQAKR